MLHRYNHVGQEGGGVVFGFFRRLWRCEPMTELEPLGSKELIRHAAGRGTLSRISAEALQKSSVLSQIEEALDESYGVETGGEVLLVTLMPDDSVSMTEGTSFLMTKGTPTKQDSVISGHNELLRAFSESSSRDRILLQTRYLNTTVLNPFQPLELCRDLTLENYPCVHGTPLSTQTLVTLGTVLVKTEELLEQGVSSVRSATLIMTDGEAEVSKEVAAVVTDMRRVGDHIVAGMGISTGNDASFRDVFRSMGIDERFIFDASSREEILRAFRLFMSEALALTTGFDD